MTWALVLLILGHCKTAKPAIRCVTWYWGCAIDGGVYARKMTEAKAKVVVDSCLLKKP